MILSSVTGWCNGAESILAAGDHAKDISDEELKNIGDSRADLLGIAAYATVCMLTSVVDAYLKAATMDALKTQKRNYDCLSDPTWFDHSSVEMITGVRLGMLPSYERMMDIYTLRHVSQDYMTAIETTLDSTLLMFDDATEFVNDFAAALVGSGA